MNRGECPRASRKILERSGFCAALDRLHMPCGGGTGFVDFGHTTIDGDRIAVAWAERVLVDGDLVSPHLALSRRRTSFAGSSARRRCRARRRRGALSDLPRLDLTLVPFGPFAVRVWELRGTVSTYDAWYVAVAEALRLPLVTLDRRLSRASGPACRFRCPTGPPEMKRPASCRPCGPFNGCGERI
jgi:predicted nucleic acid-binding protein